MRHAVILAHPRLKSFAATIADTYVDMALAFGHDVIVRDLYRMGFDPCLQEGELPGPHAYCPRQDLAAERQALVDIDVFAFVYPFWFNAPPAILKGYVDRVFSMGFGYIAEAGRTEPLLTGRRLISFSSSGAPDQWVRETGAISSLMTLFDRHLANMCGLTLLEHVHFGGIVQNLTPEWVERHKADTTQAFRRHFQPIHHTA